MLPLFPQGPKNKTNITNSLIMEASVVFPGKAPVSLKTTEFSIGRSSDNSLTFRGNKCLSGRHCHILEEPDGNFSLTDQSSNGTLVNGATKLRKGQKLILKDGDVVHLVKQKQNSENDLFFTFYLRSAENDQETQVLQDSDSTQNLEEEEQETSEKPVSPFGGTTVPVGEPEMSGSGSPEPKMPRIERISDMMRKEEKSLQRTPPEHAGPAEKKQDETPKASSSHNNENKMEETLLCSICCEIIHDCISLQPCMHSFCAGCYSEWLTRSNKCPECRNVVVKISKNHLVNNVIDAYLKEHPEKKRSEEDTKELDEKNKITQDMLYPKRKRREHEEDEDLWDSEEEYSETDDEDDQPIPLAHNWFGGNALPVGPPRTVCRQCPGYVDPRPAVAGAVGGVTVPPPFICQPQQNHILCQCCMEPMPNRARETGIAALPPISCSVCHRHFCHMYWGCRRLGCSGCLSRFRDFNFGPGCLAGIISENAYESQILTNYLRGKNKTWQDLLGECVAKLETQYQPMPVGALNVTGDTAVCGKCGMQQFRELAFQYRKDIRKEDLPAEVSARPDCYWGRGCRTQRNKPEHAQRFNHICDQTRFS